MLMYGKCIRILGWEEVTCGTLELYLVAFGVLEGTSGFQASHAAKQAVRASKSQLTQECCQFEGHFRSLFSNSLLNQIHKSGEGGCDTKPNSILLIFHLH